MNVAAFARSHAMALAVSSRATMALTAWSVASVRGDARANFHEFVAGGREDRPLTASGLGEELRAGEQPVLHRLALVAGVEAVADAGGDVPESRVVDRQARHVAAIAAREPATVHPHQ